jgi:hypothetical protein
MAHWPECAIDLEARQVRGHCRALPVIEWNHAHQMLLIAFSA